MGAVNFKMKLWYSLQIKKCFKIGGISGEIRTEHPQNITLNRYDYINRKYIDILEILRGSRLLLFLGLVKLILLHLFSILHVPVQVCTFARSF